MLNYVREGNAEEALHLNMRLDQQLGRMSQNQIMQWRKLMTVAVALASRAAIDGGASPGEAYKLSDYYLQKSDACMDVPALIACRNQAVRGFFANGWRRRGNTGNAAPMSSNAANISISITGKRSFWRISRPTSISVPPIFPGFFPEK